MKEEIVDMVFGMKEEKADVESLEVKKEEADDMEFEVKKEKADVELLGVKKEEVDDMEFEEKADVELLEVGWEEADDMESEVKKEKADVELLEVKKEEDMHWIYKREGMGYRKKVDYPSCCSYGPVTMDDPFKWEAAIVGPYDTPYEYGVFFLSIDLHPEHPSKPPAIKFLTKIFHPNIDEEGKIYVDILEEEEWRPIHTIESLLLSICSLLAEPDPVDPTFESCHLYRHDREAYYTKAREWTRSYAM